MENNQNENVEIKNESFFKRHRKKILIGLSLLILFFYLKDRTYKSQTRDVTFTPNNINYLLSVSEMWDATKELYGYFSNLPEDFDWDKEYKIAFNEVAGVTDEYDYFLAMSEFYAKLKDGHGAFKPRGSSIKSIFGQLPVYCTYLDGEYVVTITGNEIDVPLLSKLVKINKTDTKEYLEENISKYIGIHTPLAREDALANFFTKLGRVGDSVELEFEKPNGELVVKSYTYKSGQGGRINVLDSMRSKYNIVYNSDNFAVNLIERNSKKIVHIIYETMLNDNREEFSNKILPFIDIADGVILDIRHNGGGNSGNGMFVLSHFVDSNKILETHPRNISQITISDFLIIYRHIEEANELGLILDSQDTEELIKSMYSETEIEIGHRMARNSYDITDIKILEELSKLLEKSIIEHGIDESESNYNKNDWITDKMYDKPLLVLIRHDSGSAVDSTTSIAKGSNITTIGTRTRGGTGNITGFNLSSGYKVYFTMNHVVNSDGSPIWNEGIVADIQADYTVETLAEGIDNTLEEAINYLLEQ